MVTSVNPDFNVFVFLFYFDLKMKNFQSLMFVQLHMLPILMLPLQPRITFKFIFVFPFELVYFWMHLTHPVELSSGCWAQFHILVSSRAVRLGCRWIEFGLLKRIQWLISGGLEAEFGYGDSGTEAQAFRVIRDLFQVPLRLTYRTISPLTFSSHLVFI